MKIMFTLGVYCNKSTIHRTRRRKFPELKRVLPADRLSNCRDAPCVKVCPTGLPSKPKTAKYSWIRKMHRLRDAASPPLAPTVPVPLIRENKVVEKCTLCRHFAEVGEQAACVKACCANARFFGDIDDPEGRSFQGPCGCRRRERPQHAGLRKSSFRPLYSS